MKTIAKVGIAAGIAVAVIGVVAATSKKKKTNPVVKQTVQKSILPKKEVVKENKGLKFFDIFSNLTKKALTKTKDTSETDNRANFDFSKESGTRSGSMDSYGSFGF